jgi:CspA family cold shock protein
MNIGKVKWFNNELGYGFIECENEEDIFVHYGSIDIEGYKSLFLNQKVEFELIHTEKGLQAINVKEAS